MIKKLGFNKGGLKKASITTLMATGAFFCALNANADGRLEGRISDTQGKVYFDGAIVRLKELKLESSSSNGGRFSFNSVPAGTYTLIVDYLGAESVQQLVNITDDNTTRESIKIGENVDTIENVIVVGQAAGANNALNKQRAADNFKSVVSADSIGQFPDENVSEALQRVPGVFIERDQGEGRFVGVRGIDPNLNSASINGVNIPAPERDRRSVALDVIPSGLLEGLEVTKTVTPDMDGSTIGGNIEVKSLSAFDRDGMSYKVSAEANHNDLEGETSPKVAGSFTNVFDVNGGELGVAAAVSWQEREFGSEVMEGDGEWDSDIDGAGTRGPKELQQRDYEVERERLGLAFNLDWRPSDTSEYYLRTLYSEFEDQEYRQRTKYKFEDGSLNSIDANSATWDNAEMRRDFKDRYEEQKIISVVLGGMNMVDDWTYEYSVGYSKAEENEPGRRDTEFEEINPITQMGYTNLGETPDLFASSNAFDANNFELKEIVLEDNKTEDEQFTYTFDITREMEFNGHPGYVKFGAKMTNREKIDDVNAEIYDEFGTLTGTTMDNFVDGLVSYDVGNFGPSLSESAIDSFIDGNVIGSTGLQSSDAIAESAVSSARDYTINEDVKAAYIMSRVDINDLRLVYGVRYEQTDFEAKGFDARLVDGDNAEIVANKFDKDYSHVLPSINARYRLNDTMLLRAAYSQTIARPSFGDVNPSPSEIEIEEIGSSNTYELKVEAGNPDLDPYESQNFDLGFEFYPGDIGAFGVSAFYKKIDNFIFKAETSSIVDPDTYAPGYTVDLDEYEVIKPLNGKSADLYGLELTYTKSFENGFLVQANATFTQSDADLDLGVDVDRDTNIDLPEQADEVGNLVLGYEKGPWSLRLSAAYKSERLIELDLEDEANDLYQDDHMQIDLTAKMDVSDNMQLYFNAININDEPYYRYHGKSKYNAQYEEYGPSFVLGITYRNF
ncbi:TonB-dependent receptor [Maricurvus nonylphenolicus]|uniref:TonB-dependent receptor n=1 Tax=Maricurvus nonylphenolicus TaxID=1008307 RepID=UPI0036F2DE04